MSTRRVFKSLFVAIIIAAILLPSIASASGGTTSSSRTVPRYSGWASQPTRDDPENGSGGLMGAGGAGRVPVPGSSQYYQYEYSGYRANVGVSGYWQPNRVWYATERGANDFTTWLGKQAWPAGADPVISSAERGYYVYYNEWIRTTP